MGLRLMNVMWHGGLGTRRNNHGESIEILGGLGLVSGRVVRIRLCMLVGGILA